LAALSVSEQVEVLPSTLTSEINPLSCNKVTNVVAVKIYTD